MKANSSDPLQHPPLTFAEIDISALTHNLRELKRIAGGSTGIMAAVKADAYGHGAVEVSRIAAACGAEFLAVARIEEACHLREAGIETPILLLGACLPEYVSCMADNEIRASINSPADARILSDEALRLGRTLCSHLKIDTGMGRLGMTAGNLDDPDEGADQVMEISGLPGIRVEGIITHLACADFADKTSAREQVFRFRSLLSAIEGRGLHIKYRHAANSAAAMEMPEARLDMIRPGIAVYGLWPSDEVDRNILHLRPVMTLKSRIIQIKRVEAGFAVSYGSTFVTSRPSLIATVPVGYADGYDRRLSNRGAMLVRGMRAPVVGRVCMDLTMIDVTDIPGASQNDEVVIMGRQGDQEISADEIAGILGTINYEVVSTISGRVRRISVNGSGS
jgi:alanine racemase